MAISRKMNSKIHVAKNQLGLSDEDYRAILKAHFNRKSSKDLTPIQAEKLIRHFQKLGWEPTKQQKLPGTSIPEDGQSKKIQALWITLSQAGVIRNASNKSLMAFVKGQTKTKTHPGKDHLSFCTRQDKSDIIEALKAMAKRENVDVG